MADEELKKLREQYEEAARRALEPHQKRHIEALEAFVRRATQAGDLDAAVKGKDELQRFRAESGMMENPFIGQWEYRYNNNTYRRIIRENGTAELWREGKVWLQSNGKPWWSNITWKKIGKTIELRRADGRVVGIWELKKDDLNTVIQTAPGSSKKEVFRRAFKLWSR